MAGYSKTSYRTAKANIRTAKPSPGPAKTGSIKPKDSSEVGLETCKAKLEANRRHKGRLGRSCKAPRWACHALYIAPAIIVAI